MNKQHIRLKQFIRKFDRAIEDVRKGRVYTMEEFLDSLDYKKIPRFIKHNKK